MNQKSNFKSNGKSNGKSNCRGTLFLTCLMLITGYLMIKQCSLAQLKAILAEADMIWLVPGFLLMVAFVGCEAAIIRSMLGCFGRKVSWRRSMSYSFAGFYFSSVTPSSTGGQPMQAFYMKRDDIPLAQSSFTLMVITSFYQLAIMFTGLIAYVCSYELLINSGHFVKLLLIMEMGVNLLAATALLLMVFEPSLTRRMGMTIIGFLKRVHLLKADERWRQKFCASIDEYSEGKRYLKSHPAVAVKAAVLSLVQVVCLYFVPFFACKALGLAVDIRLIVIRQALLSLAVTAVPLPGAVGASEGVFAILYQALASQEMLIPLLVLSRGMSFYGFLVLSGGVVLLLNWRQTHWKPA